MHKASTKGFWKCLAACTAVCGAGCLACLLDGPIFIADTATGGAALASGSSAGLKYHLTVLPYNYEQNESLVKLRCYRLVIIADFARISGFCSIILPY